jgi:gluconolactonase
MKTAALALISSLVIVAVSAQVPAGPALREVRIAPIPGIIDAGASWQLVWQGPDNADGLIGLPDGSVLFAQEQSSRVRRLAVDGSLSTHLENTHGTGALALDAQGRLLGVQRACTDPGRAPALPPCSETPAVAILSPQPRVVADRFQNQPLGRLNDLVVDRLGRVYFTAGGAYAAAPGAAVVSLGDGIRANGIMLSPDEKTLYVTNGATILAFDIQADGRAVNRRDFGTLEAGGNGDGMAIDAAGRLYVTSAAGVQVLGADGKHLGLIPAPRSAISAAFAGSPKRTLFIVGSGALDADGKEHVEPAGVRNNAKAIFRIAMLAEGFAGRAK